MILEWTTHGHASKPKCTADRSKKPPVPRPLASWLPALGSDFFLISYMSIQKWPMDKAALWGPFPTSGLPGPSRAGPPLPWRVISLTPHPLACQDLPRPRWCAAWCPCPCGGIKGAWRRCHARSGPPRSAQGGWRSVRCSVDQTGSLPAWEDQRQGSTDTAVPTQVSPHIHRQLIRVPASQAEAPWWLLSRSQWLQEGCGTTQSRLWWEEGKVAVVTS